MITVLVVDDHELVRTGICRMLEDHAEIQVIGQAESGEEAISLVRQHHPNVVLLDVNMPGIGGVETTRRLLQTAPETKVLAVSGLAEEPYPSLLLKAGAKGYMLKTSSAAEILNSIRKVYRGEEAIETEVDNKIKYHDSHPNLHDDLTARERDILALLAKGYDNQTIANELFISLKTVKTHVSNILGKLNVDDRTQAVVYAFRHHLVSQDDE